MKKFYKNVTNIWIKNKNKKVNKVIDQMYFKYNNKIYLVDKKNVILDYSKKEKEIAIWLVNTFGGIVKMIPRVNNPEGIKTPDYIWNEEHWDLKYIKNATSKRAIDNVLKKAKGQTKNFIIDITSSNFEIEEIKKQIIKIYNTSGREWINKIILKKSNNVIGIFINKRD